MANMALQLKKSLTAVVIGLCIAGLMAIAVVALLQSGPTDEDGEQLPKRFSYDIQALREIDAALIKFKETLSIPIEMDVPRAIAVGPADANRKSAEKIYVGGDRQILVFDGDRSKAASYPLEFEPRALAVMPARIYVAAASRVFVLDGDGGLIDTWPDRGGRALFTSITVDRAENESGDNDVYVADAGNRLVLRYNSDGKLLGEIDRLSSLKPTADDDPKASRLGFIVPSPFFDVAMGGDGLLRVVNPGMHEIEAYTPEGLLEKPLTWGTTGFNIEGFCGCCNPAALAIMPDGRFVTGEKGLPRVKVYSPQGRFECVVAGPKTLDPTGKSAEDTREGHKLTAVDLAVDDDGQVLVLDPKARAVRVFVEEGR